MGLAGWWDGHRVARAFALLVVLPAAGGGLLALVLVAGGASVKVTNSSAKSGPTSAVPEGVKPIAIPVRACTYLQAVRAAGLAAHRAPAASSTAQLQTLQLALRVAAPQVPEPLRLKLEESADFAGEFDSFTRAKGIAPDFFASMAGLGAVDDANHLVGSACGFAPPLRRVLEWP